MMMLLLVLVLLMVVVVDYFGFLSLSWLEVLASLQMTNQICLVSVLLTCYVLVWLPGVVEGVVL